MDHEVDSCTPLLLGNMEAETKNPHDVRFSSADSVRLDPDRSNNGEALEKKAPWWSYFWVSTNSTLPPRGKRRKKKKEKKKTERMARMIANGT